VGNLASNAATYGCAGTPIVVRSGIDDGVASVEVHNEGEPIPSEILATVFQPMVRGITGSNTVRSVGLGLFIVNEIAKAHSGEMAVVSSASQGTTFTLRFPAHRGQL
jgi:sigma-B regulation protein RsbU (phosphoserine phosphatase)